MILLFQDTTWHSKAELGIIFERIGAIESIEMLKNEQSAYVTFYNSYSVYEAIESKSTLNRIIVRIADTWHQPPPFFKLDKDPAPIFKLVDDCFIEIFKYCDLEAHVSLANTCKMFKNLLHANFFPHVRSMDFGEMSLADMRSTLRCVGPYVQRLTLNHATERHLQKLNQYVGENIRELTLCHTSIIDLNLLKTILPRLHYLKIQHVGCVMNQKLLATDCPNLIKLTLPGLWNLETIARLKIPSLTSLSFDSEYCKTHIDSGNLKDFVRENYQLTEFKANAKLIHSKILRHLPKVEKLSVDLEMIDNLNYFYEAQWDTNRNLTKFTAYNVKGRYMYTLFDVVGRLKQLQELKVYAVQIENSHIEDYQLKLVSVAQTIPQLRKFVLHGVTLLKSTVIDFIRCAPRLQEFHIHNCIMMTSNEGELETISIESVVGNIANARKRIRNKGNGPLKLFVDPHVHNSLESFIKNSQEYLTIKTDCKHERG